MNKLNPYAVTSIIDAPSIAESEDAILLDYWHESLVIDNPLTESEAQQAFDAHGKKHIQGAFLFLCFGFSCFCSMIFLGSNLWNLTRLCLFASALIIFRIDQQFRSASPTRRTILDVPVNTWRFWELQKNKPWNISKLVFAKDWLMISESGQDASINGTYWMDYRMVLIQNLNSSVQIFTPSGDLLGISSRALSEVDTERILTFVGLFNKHYRSIEKKKLALQSNPEQTTVPLPPEDSLVVKCDHNPQEVRTFYAALDLESLNPFSRWAQLRFFMVVYRTQLLSLLLWCVMIGVGLTLVLTETMEVYGSWFVLAYVLLACLLLNRTSHFVAIRSNIRQHLARQTLLRVLHFTPLAFYSRTPFGTAYQTSIRAFSHWITTKDYLVAWDESGYLFVKEEWLSSAADFQQLVSWFRASVPEGSRESLRRFLFKLNGSAIHEDNSS